MKFVLYLVLFFVGCQAQTNFSNIFEGFSKSLELSPVMHNESLKCISVFLNVTNILTNSQQDHLEQKPLQRVLMTVLRLSEQLESSFDPSCAFIYQSLLEYWNTDVNITNILQNLRTDYPDIIELIGLILYDKKPHFQSDYDQGRMVAGIIERLLKKTETPQKNNVVTFNIPKVEFNLTKFYQDFFKGFLTVIRMDNQTLIQSLSQCAIDITLLLDPFFTEASDRKKEMNMRTFLEVFSSCQNAYLIAESSWKNNSLEIFKFHFSKLLIDFPVYQRRIQSIQDLVNRGRYNRIGARTGTTLLEIAGRIESFLDLFQ